MTSTYDHRVIQGAQSGEFLGRIEALLNGADDFYTSVFESLGIGLPAADIPRSGAAASAATPAAAPQPAPAATGGCHRGRCSAPCRRRRRSSRRTAPTATSAPTSTRWARRRLGDPAMEPETYGLTPDLMEQIPADVLRVYVPGRNLAEVLPNLRRTYCGTIAYEIEHIASHEQRVWLREHIESGAYRMPFSPDQKRRLLQRLTKVEAMERYLRRTFIGQKTFSAEGVDAMIPMLEGLLTAIADDGIGEVVMGMAHRGRLATIAHVVNRPYAAILVAFERGEMRRAVASLNDAPTGDVKYHIGSTGTYVTDTGKGITVRLLSNPSHLEAVDPVVEGWTRAEQTRRELEHAARRPHGRGAGAAPRRRRLRRPGHRRRGVQPAVAARLRHRRHRAHHHQQPGGLHHRCRATRARRATRATWPRGSTSPSCTSTPTTSRPASTRCGWPGTTGARTTATWSSTSSATAASATTRPTSRRTRSRSCTRRSRSTPPRARSTCTSSSPRG